MPDPLEILLVEDDPADLELTLHALQNENIANRIHVARDGEEALDFLFCRGKYADRSNELLPSLVLLDLKLPKVDGMEVLRAIRAHSATRMIPVVILTSSREERDLITGYAEGANTFIQKPVDFDRFRQTVRQLGLYWLVAVLPPRQSLAETQP